MKLNVVRREDKALVRVEMNDVPVMERNLFRQLSEIHSMSPENLATVNILGWIHLDSQRYDLAVVQMADRLGLMQLSIPYWGSEFVERVRAKEQIFII